MSSKIKVDIWSDIMCPFCYIGKRHFEKALENFPEKEHVEIEWHSFQLDPDIPTQIEQRVNVYEYLAKSKGISFEQSRQMHDRVVEMAADAGLDYRFDIAVVANSFKAHRVIQLAKEIAKGDAAEEKLFQAYFTEGKDFGSDEVLTGIGAEIGLSTDDIRTALTNENYANKVIDDIAMASSLGIRAVPFFVFNMKFGVSGAQPVATFTEALNKAKSL